MPTTRTQLIFFAAGGFCAACTPTPRLRLAFTSQQVASPAGATDSYAFPRTFVEVAPLATADLLSFTARNQTYEDFRVALSRSDSWGVKTSVSLTKVANSDMLDEVGVSTKDDRITVIEDVGKVVGAILPFVGLAAGDACPAVAKGANAPIFSSPLTIDSLAVLQRCNVASDTTGEVTDISSWRHLGSFDAWFGPLPPDALSVHTADPTVPFAPLTGARFEHGIIYAACREMRVRVGVNPGSGSQGKSAQPNPAPSTADDHPVESIRSVYVADPRYFRYIALPYKGSIKIHPQCGTSTTTDSTAAPSSDLAVASAIIAQAKVIKDAIDKGAKK